MNNAISRIKKEEGFTLVELLIVIVVLGILAGIVIFAVGNTKDQADAASTTANDKICRQANAAAQAEYGNGYTLANINEYLSVSNAGDCVKAIP